MTGLLIVLILYSTAAFYTTEVLDFAPEFPPRGKIYSTRDQLWSINGERVYLYSDVNLLLSLDGDGLVDMEVRRRIVDLEPGSPVSGGTNSEENGAVPGHGLDIGVERPPWGKAWVSGSTPSTLCGSCG